MLSMFRCWQIKTVISQSTSDGCTNFYGMYFPQRMTIQNYILLVNCNYIIPSGFRVTDEQLEEVANHSEVLEVPTDYLTPEFRRRCEVCLPNPEEIESKDCKDSFIFLKNNI